MNDNNEIMENIRDIDMQINIHKTQIHTMRNMSATELTKQIERLQNEKTDLLEELGSQQMQISSSEEKNDLNLDFSSIKDHSDEEKFILDVKKEEAE